MNPAAADVPLLLTRATSALDRDGLHPLRRGVYVDAHRWQHLRDGEKHLLKVRAVAATARSAKTFSHHSAAALWGLPVLGRWPDVVDHWSAQDHRGRGAGERRRRTRAPATAVTRHGLDVTTAARTVVDLARTIPLEHALPAADHAVHRGMCTPEDLARELALVPPRGRGRRMAGLVVRLVDGRSESAGESLSRARMFQLGLPRPDLQVEVRDERGVLLGRADFGWPGLLGEFDGKVKYRRDALGLDDRLATDVVIEEKVREDRLRATGARVARWVWDDAWDLDRMLVVMRRAGLTSGHTWW